MILERLKEYIDFKGISISAFEKSIGMGNASFGKSLKNNGAIGTDKLEKILIQYTDISFEWLLTGRGQMIKTSGVLNDNQATYQDKKDLLLNLDAQNKLLEDNQSARAEISDLKEELRIKNKQLGDLIKTNLLLLEREKEGGISHQGVDSKLTSVG